MMSGRISNKNSNTVILYVLCLYRFIQALDDSSKVDGRIFDNCQGWKVKGIIIIMNCRSISGIY